MYTITDFNLAAGQVIVKFFELDGEVAIDLPINDCMFPEGDALDSYIKGFVPSWLLDRKQKLKDIKNAEYFNKFINESKHSVESKSEEIRKIRDQELRNCDWVMLPDTGFSEDAINRFKEYRQKLRDVPQQAGFPTVIEWPTAAGEWPNRPEMN